MARPMPACGSEAAAAPRARNPIAAPHSARTSAGRRNGSQRPVARSGSPNGLWVVTPMIAAAHASTRSGQFVGRVAAADHQWYSSAAHRTRPQASSARSAAGTRRLRRCSQTSRAAAGTRHPGGVSGDHGLRHGAGVARRNHWRCPGARSWDLRQGDRAGLQGRQVRDQPGVPGRGGQRRELGGDGRDLRLLRGTAGGGAVPARGGYGCEPSAFSSPSMTACCAGVPVSAELRGRRPAP